MKMDSGLLRQRRNLIAISSVLIIYDFAAIKINQIGWMGTSIEVGNPVALSVIIWMVWFYFLVRYYQYWSEDKSSYIWIDLTEMVRFKAHVYCSEKHGIDKNTSWNGTASLERKRLFSWHAIAIKERGANEKPERKNYSIPILLLMWWSLAAFVTYCVNKKHVTEHLLPFALAIVAVCMKLFSMV